MDIQTNSIEVSKTARYSTYGILSERTQYFWFVLHGSSMLCEQMLYKFKDFDPLTHFVVAPEALSRYYLNGFGGDVVAGWMTSRDRLDEINDFSKYLTTLYQLFETQLPHSARKTILGFSQGGTTVFRWLHQSKIRCDNLIAYSCWIPEDIDLSQSETNLEEVKLIYTYGTEDQYLDDSRINALSDIIRKNSLSIPMLPYSGDHRVDRNHLASLFQELYA